MHELQIPNKVCKREISKGLESCGLGGCCVGRSFADRWLREARCDGEVANAVVRSHGIAMISMSATKR
jgi:hypothetical protein